MRKLIWVIGLMFLVSQALEASRDQIPRILDKANFYLQNGNALSAKDYLSRAKAIDPNDSEVVNFEQRLQRYIDGKVAEHLRQGDFYSSNKQVPQAIEQYNLALRYCPGHPEVTERLRKLIEIKTKVRNLKESGVVVAPSSGRSYDLDAYSSVSEMMKAKAAFNNGDYQRAMELIDQILSHDPNYKEASDLRKEIVKRQEFRDLVTGASTKTSSGNFQQAEEYYTRLIELQPEKVELLINRGKARIRLGKFAEGLDDFGAAFRKKGKLEDMRHDMVTGLVGMKEFPQALGLAGSHKNNPAVEPLSFRIWCYWKSYRVSCSLFFLNLLLLIGSIVWVSHNLGALMEKGRYILIKEGVICLIRCISGPPEAQVEKLRHVSRQLNHPWFHYFSGLLLISLDRLDQAQEHLQGAIASVSLAPRAYFFLGLVRSRLNQKLSQHDFEQTLILGMKEHPMPWIPRFVGDFERKIFEAIAPEERRDEMVVLAWKTMKCLLEA